MHSVRQLLEGKAARVISVAQETPVLEVIRLMAEHGIGSVLVMRGDQLIGIATERDYARKVILKGRSSQDTPVSDVMSSPVISVSPGDDVRHCMQIVTERRIRHLPVIEEQKQEIEQLQQYIAG
jgi:CBS domain-containing protein